MSNKCSATVYDRTMNFPRPHGCRNNATKQHEGGWYCAKHHPEAVKDRRDKLIAKYDEQTRRTIAERRKQFTDAQRAAMFGELVEALEWYVENDDVNEADEENEYWIEGLRNARVLIAKAKELK